MLHYFYRPNQKVMIVEIINVGSTNSGNWGKSRSSSLNQPLIRTLKTYYISDLHEH